MSSSNDYLLVFSVAFMACALAIPWVTRLAHIVGAVDRPDQFRRIHKRETPRMGGLGLVIAVVLGLVAVVWMGSLRSWDGYSQWLGHLPPLALASAIIVAVGVVDDSKGIGPRVKLLGQGAAVMALYFGGVRIDSCVILGIPLDFTFVTIPIDVAGFHGSIAPVGLFVTLFWFLACMNVWNLIDGMDGLACGVGLLVSATLALVALQNGNPGVAFLAISLAGGLAGFLLFNWHPACIFLGDTGSLLIGLLLGVIGVEGAIKGSSAISILFPILAMGLPITDTAMAIFRRWVRNLPLSSADRRHVHHLLIGMGLNPRQAALILYVFTAGLCGVVMLGVVVRSEFLALVLGISGCMAFLLILTSRRDELATLRADFVARFARRNQERFAAKIAWEAIQRVELCQNFEGIWNIMLGAANAMGCDGIKVDCRRGETVVYENAVGPDPSSASGQGLSGATATFRLNSGEDLRLVASLHQTPDATIEADIAFRFLQRLSLATAERIERLIAEAEGRPDPDEPNETDAVGPRALTESDSIHTRIEPLASSSSALLFGFVGQKAGMFDRLRILLFGPDRPFDSDTRGGDR